MKLVLAVILFVTACKKTDNNAAPAAGSGSAAATGSAAGSGSAVVAAPAPDVNCDAAGKEYAKKMAASPGNILSNAKPDEGLIHFTGISMSDYCEGEDGLVPWTTAEKSCVMSSADVTSCFSGAALSQVNAGLQEVVTSALENKKKNEAAAGSAGSAGSGSGSAP